MVLMYDPVELTRRLIAVPGTSGREQDVAETVIQIMRELRFKRVDVDDLGNVIGISGPAKGPPAVLFDGHLDTVAVTGQWTVDPYAGIERDGRLYGRGATDMKAGLAAALAGVAEAAANGLSRSVAVSATVLEETIEGVGIASVCDALSPERVVICEPTDLSVNTGQRGRAEVLLTVKGIPAHAAHPEVGHNALLDLARALSELAARPTPTHPLLGDGILVPTDVITDPYPSISLLPTSATARFDRRTLVGETAESVLDDLRTAMDKLSIDAELSIGADEVTTYTGRTVAAPRFLPAWSIARDDPFVRAAVQAVRSNGTAVSLGAYGFCTNGSETAGVRGIPTVGLGPGAESGAHVPDEAVEIDQIVTAANIYRNLTLQVAGG